MADGSNPFAQYDTPVVTTPRGTRTNYVSTITGPLDNQGHALLPLVHRLEGSGDQAVSPKGAVGRNQIMPQTARAYGFYGDLSDPAYNDQVASAILTDLNAKYHGDTQAVLIGYNSTPGRVAKFLANGRDPDVLLPETQKYLQHANEILNGTGSQNPFTAFVPPAADSAKNPFAQYASATGADNPFAQYAQAAPARSGGTGGFANALDRLWGETLGNIEKSGASIVQGLGQYGDKMARVLAQEGADTGFIVDPATGARQIVPETLRPQLAALATSQEPIASAVTGPAAASLRGQAQQNIPANPSLLEKGVGLGASFVPFALSGPAGFAASNYADTYNDAIAHGATAEAADRAASISGAVGGIAGALPVGGPGAALIERYGLGGVAKYGTEALNAGVSNAALMAGIQTGTNVVAQQNYDPTRTWSEGVPEAALVGGLGGAGVHALVGAGAGAFNAARTALTPRADVATGMPETMPATNALQDYIGTPAPAEAAEPVTTPVAPVAQPTTEAPPVAIPAALAPNSAESAAVPQPIPAVVPKTGGAEQPIPPNVSPAAHDMLQGVTPETVASAARDIDEWKAAAPRGYSLFTAMKDLGGVALKDANGVPYEGADVGAALADVRRPGLVNNKSGLSPEYMMQQLSDQGWFGSDGSTDPTDFEALLDREAHGSKVYHPEADTAVQLVRREQLDHDMAMAGVLRTDKPDIAAAKLARYRADEQAQQAPEGQALGLRAEELGVPQREGVTPQDELLADVLEREAIQGEATDADADAYRRSINLQLTDADRQHLEALSREGITDRDAEVGSAEPLPAGWELEPGVPEAYRESPAGPEGAGEDQGAAPAQAGGELAPKVQTFEQYAAEHGASQLQYSNAGVHNPMDHLSDAAKRRIMTGEQARLTDLQRRRDDLRMLYDQAVRNGEIREPTSQETLEATAAGDPDSARTQAAQRVLERRTERMRLAGGETVDQGVMPGMEASARQAAAAREGPLRAGVPQEAPGGLFAPKEENPFDMFDPDRDPNKPLFNRPQAKSVPGLPSFMTAMKLEDPTAREQGVMDAVEAVLAKIAPMAESRPYAALRDRGQPFHGASYRDGLRNVIAWSLESPDAIHVARHEAIHSLISAGVVTPDEWNTLANAALHEGWLDRFNIERRYPDLTHAQQIEEAVAERFGQWRRDSVSSLPPALAAVFKRIAMVLQQVGDGLRRVFGKAATADDVFSRIESGEVGKRPIGSAVGREEPRLDRSGPPRRFGIPKEAASISSHHSVANITSHPDYRAAKSGDREAAYNLVRDRVGAKAIATANEKFGPGALYVPVHAQEAAGRNKIPSALAAHYAAATDGSAVGDIIQTNKSYHTGARPMPRLIRRALFSGPVTPGGRYILVDDVNVMGSTLAELANHIRSNGGEVIGVATLANQSRTGLYAARPEHVRLLEARHGNEIHDNLGLAPSALTGDEAAYLANFRDTDSLRAGIAKARSEEQSGILPGAPSGGVKFARPDDRAVERTRGLFNNLLGSGAESVGRKLQAKTEAAIPEPVADLLDAVKTGVSPMGMGSERGQAAAKDFANALRATAFQWGKVDEWLQKTFTPAERRLMWTAADEHGVILRQGREPGENEGKNVLDPRQRAAVEEIQSRADAAFKAAQDLGMVQGDGLESYVPRMIVQMTTSGPKIVSRATPRQIERGGNLSTTTGQLRQRKYETAEETEAAAKTAFGENTEVVRDIRTLALGTQRLEQAIAGRTLVGKIKDMSAQGGGADLVTEGGNPDDNLYFTMEHAALQKWGPKFITTPEGKRVPVVDQNGDTVFEATPLYISREFEGPLKAVLSTRTSRIARALLDLKGKMLSIVMYSPLIHNAVIWGKAIPADPVGVLTLGAYFKGHSAKLDPKTMSEAIQAGMDPIGHRFFNQDITGIAAAEGQDIAPGRSWTAQLLAYVPSLFDKEAGNEVKRFVDKAGDVWHNTFLWDRIADLQAGLYVHFRDHLIAAGEDPLSAQRMAAHFANRYAGALPMETLSKAARTTANLVLFSRSFTLGNVALFKDVVMGMPSDVRAQILRDAGRTGLDNIQGVARQKAAGMLALDVALSFVGLNLASLAVSWLTGEKFQPTYQNEPGKTQRFLIGYQQDGTAIYGRLPTGKVGEELWDWPTDFRDTLLRKLSPYMKLAYAMAANDKGFGQALYDKFDHTPLGFAKNIGRVMAFAAGDIAPESQMQAIHDAVVGGKGIDRKTATLGAIGPALGLTISRGAPGGPAMADIYAVKDEQQFRWQEARADVFKQIKGGDIVGARARMTELGVSPGLQKYYIRTAINPAARMSKRALQDFMFSANAEERARLAPDRAAEAARANPAP